MARERAVEETSSDDRRIRREMAGTWKVDRPVDGGRPVLVMNWRIEPRVDLEARWPQAGQRDHAPPPTAPAELALV